VDLAAAKKIRVWGQLPALSASILVASDFLVGVILGGLFAMTNHERSEHCANGACDLEPFRMVGSVTIVA